MIRSFAIAHSASFNIGLVGLLTAVTACAGGGTAASPTPAPAASVSAGGSGARLSVTMGQMFPLHVGQTASVAGVSSDVTFRGVQADSRCPSGTQCVQAGNAEVLLEVATGGGAPVSITLNSTTPPREKALGNGILRLVSLSPTPLAGTTIEPSSYVATLCVCRE
jgi:hypothetical protein